MRISDWSSDVCSSDLHRERVDSQRPSAKFIDTKARSQSETFPSRLPPAPAKVINEILDPVWRNWGLVKTPNAGAKWARGSVRLRSNRGFNTAASAKSVTNSRQRPNWRPGRSPRICARTRGGRPERSQRNVGADGPLVKSVVEIRRD